ncbi:very-long-chain (3R)-3-hydroxyacyl-CoA dehydratase 4 isoform X3 [Ictalurus furcatus]|nr:very-long-chain (3R)-3-hydroxyacyl-CoA dehydratase 4 isoform X3 [Ictalurus furcatus]
MTARFLSFGLDALAGTFYFVGVMMSLCLLLSVLELFHIADGIEESQLLPRLVQVIERNFLLLLIISQEEFQSKTVVCVLFYLWNTLHLIRYPYQLMCLISTPSFNMLWVRYTIAIPVYILSVITEGPRVWRKSGETQNPSCLKSSVKFPQSVMIWGVMSSAGVGPLCFLKLRVNAASTRRFLEHFMLPSADELYGDGDFLS